jgi:hypothetical protein
VGQQHCCHEIIDTCFQITPAERSRDPMSQHATIQLAKQSDLVHSLHLFLVPAAVATTEQIPKHNLRTQEARMENKETTKMYTKGRKLQF